jgi:chitinase
MNLKLRKFLLFSIIIIISIIPSFAQSGNNIKVLAYYAGGPDQLEHYNVNSLTHIIFSFGRLDGHKLSIRTARDTATVQKMVELKSKNPQLKVLLSLGGWGGCETCSDVFATEVGRREFSESVKEINQYFRTDGIDLDWEYPAIPGPPDHKYAPEDKRNFTLLVQELRKTLGNENEISFAAGGTQRFLEESVEWSEVMEIVDFVNLMTYDLVGGGSPITGHHTALFSTPQQERSADYAVQYLLNMGIPSQKLIVGGAFYGRIFEDVPQENNGLYQPGKFKSYEIFRNFADSLKPEEGYKYYWDDEAKAPFMYNAQKKHFVTFDDTRSIGLKTQYVINNNLGGIMFWHLAQDKFEDGLLDAITKAKSELGERVKE